MLKIIVILLLAGLGLLLAYAAIKPAKYVIKREIAISASPEKIFPYLNNSELSGQWMPWEEADPQMKMTYSGPESGVGSKASWDSPGKMGTGSSTISESIQNQTVKYCLETVKPFQIQQEAEISIKTVGGQSVVTWSVTGSNPFIGRLMCNFMNMDKMVGGSFERGLAKLKNVLEAGK